MSDKQLEKRLGKVTWKGPHMKREDYMQMQRYSDTCKRMGLCFWCEVPYVDGVCTECGAQRVIEHEEEA
jgi:hypothetical protein